MCSSAMKQFICLLVVYIFLNVSPIKTEKCATPDSKEGECKDLDDCASLSDFVQRMKWSKEDLKFYQDSICVDTNGLVCCMVSNTTRVFVPRKPQTPERVAVVLDQRFGEDDDEYSLPDNCGVSPRDDDKIIYGIVADLGEFPWMALLKYMTNLGPGYACGGALINKRHVLTAAHCVTGRLGEPFEVTVGEYDTDSKEDCQLLLDDTEVCAPPPQHVKIDKIFTHPQYSKASGKPNDIAILRLDKPVTYTDYVAPICLVTPDIESRVAASSKTAKPIVAGWGETRNRPVSNILMKARVPIIDRSICGANKSFAITEKQICAGGGKEDSCRGDSGGPLMARSLDSKNNLRHYCMGVVSIGPTVCGTLDKPAIYTNVVPYIDWIKNTIKK